MPADLKLKLLEYALDQGKASTTTRNFIKALVEAQRTAIIPGVIDSFAELLNEAEGKVTAEVASAQPLDDAAKAEITAGLEKVLKKKIEIAPTVDPSLLGGFKVRVGNFLVDLSLKTRLDSLSAGAVADRIG
jgi:F-type H+-transporting ATPase subunit delta